ncbi:hypothetical protein TNCV_3137371 [Trichonephila clavipes]|nr:hypothetical protein TNCV_3137371 [Trichonephila clavipes]
MIPKKKISQEANCYHTNHHHTIVAMAAWWLWSRILDQNVVGATETSRNITARVIERDTSGKIYYVLEDSRGFRTRQHGRQIGLQK